MRPEKKKKEIYRSLFSAVAKKGAHSKRKKVFTGGKREGSGKKGGRADPIPCASTGKKECIERGQKEGGKG